MNANEAIINFRNALIALLPFIETSNVSWRPDEAYDEWDAIISALYIGLVGGPLAWSNARNECIIMPYDTLVECIEGYAYLMVRSERLKDGNYIFHSFSTRDKPFDLVLCRLLVGMNMISNEIRTVEFEATQFQLIMSGS